MYTKDPLERIEAMLHEINESASKRSAPVLKRYPLLFAFLLTFSAAAIVHGFGLMIRDVVLFEQYPILLIVLGSLVLLLTGTLYSTLQKK